jgi:hypothetical protein
MKLSKLFSFIVLLSELIFERNKARHELAEKKSIRNTDSKPVEDKISKSKIESNSQSEEEISSVVLYEEKVDIIGSKSRRTLSKGVAYIDKKGQIVRIKILKE